MRLYERNSLSVRNRVFLLLFLLGLGILMVVTPKYSDDYNFMMQVRPWFAAQGIDNPTDGGDIFGYGVPWSLIRETWQLHIDHDNARLGNLLVVPALLLPKWPVSLLVLVMWVGVMWVSLKAASVDAGRSRLVAAAVFMWSFFMAWSQHTGALDYQFNYVMPSGVLFLYLYGVARSGGNLLPLILIFVCGIVAGAWHEGFTVPAASGLAACMLVSRQMRCVKYWVALAALLAGLGLIALAPGFADRIATSTGPENYTPARAASVVAGHSLYFILLVMLLWCRLAHKQMESKDRMLLLFLLVSGAVSLIIQFVASPARRGGWWCDIVSVVGVLVMLRVSAPLASRKLRRIRGAAYWILMLVSVAHWAAVDVYAFRLRHDADEILRKHLKEGERVVFADIDTFYDLPAICMNTPDCGMFVSDAQLHFFNLYYHDHNREEYLNVVPESLRLTDSGSGEAIAGTAGWRRIDGHIFREAVNGQRSWGDARVWINGKYAGALKFEFVPFTSEIDGKNYEYVYPWHGQWAFSLGKITRVDENH